MSQEGFAFQGGTYTAEVTRHAIGSILQRGGVIGSIVGGVVVPGDLSVTAGSTLHVKVAGGEAWITGTSVSTQGAYYFRNTASAELAFAAASATNPRIETIIAQVKDKTYAGTEETFTVAVVEGVATSGATLVNKAGAGAVPASSLVLAYVLIPANAGTVSAGNIENTVVGVKPIPLVTPVTRSTSFTAVVGEYVQSTASASITATLPTGAAAGGMIGFMCNEGATATFTIKAGAGSQIYNPSGHSEELRLLAGQHVLLIAQSETRWNVIAGEGEIPSNYGLTKNFTKAEMEAGVVLSSNLHVFAVIYPTTVSAAEYSIFVGGTAVATVYHESSRVISTAYLMIGPGQAVKTTGAMTVIFAPQ